jgi:hypothetical protein
MDYLKQHQSQIQLTNPSCKLLLQQSTFCHFAEICPCCAHFAAKASLVERTNSARMAKKERLEEQIELELVKSISHPRSQERPSHKKSPSIICSGFFMLNRAQYPRCRT